MLRARASVLRAGARVSGWQVGDLPKFACAAGHCLDAGYDKKVNTVFCIGGGLSKRANSCSRAGAHLYQGPHSSPQPTPLTALSYSPQCVSTMVDDSRRRNGQGGVIPTLNTAIDDLNLASLMITSTIPVSPVFGSVVTLLTMVRVSSSLFHDEMYHVYTKIGYDGRRAGLC